MQPAIAGLSREISAQPSICLQAGGRMEQSGEHSRRTTMNQVLDYMKRAFDEDDFLDHVPSDAAGNAGAWKAWRAYRASSSAQIQQGKVGAQSPDDGEEWNWDGVWEQRVRRGGDTSISNSVLYGGTGGGDDLVSSKPLSPERD